MAHWVVAGAEHAAAALSNSLPSPSITAAVQRPDSVDWFNGCGVVVALKQPRRRVLRVVIMCGVRVFASLCCLPLAAVCCLLQLDSTPLLLIQPTARTALAAQRNDPTTHLYSNKNCHIQTATAWLSARQFDQQPHGHTRTVHRTPYIRHRTAHFEISASNNTQHAHTTHPAAHSLTRRHSHSHSATTLCHTPPRSHSVSFI